MKTARILLTLLCVGVMSGCDVGANGDVKTKDGVPVSIHGVNYTANEMSYRIQDPKNAENKGGGEILNPYSAGGTMCCYSLPKKWQPGIQVEVKATMYFPPEMKGGSIREVKESHIVEVPQYADGKAGELWILRNADKSFSVVSSNYQPDHPQWPGAVKGWPEPDTAYMRQRWDLHIKLAQESVNRDKQSIVELDENPAKSAAEYWEFYQAFNAKYGGQAEDQLKSKAHLAKFSGPTDPKFIEWLKKDYAESLARSQAKLKHLQDTRP